MDVMTQDILQHYWPVIMTFGGLIVWGARLETKLRDTISRSNETRHRQDRLEERIARDLDAIKDDSSIIKATLEGIQGYMRATREFQEQQHRR